MRLLWILGWDFTRLELWLFLNNIKMWNWNFLIELLTWGQNRLVRVRLGVEFKLIQSSLHRLPSLQMILGIRNRILFNRGLANWWFLWYLLYYWWGVGDCLFLRRLSLRLFHLFGGFCF
jgi:hypothetical protein